MANAFKIEKNVPLPQEQARGRYPFAEMQIGDSFLVPAGDAHLLRANAYPYASKHNVKFSVRKVEGGARCVGKSIGSGHWYSTKRGQAALERWQP